MANSDLIMMMVVVAAAPAVDDDDDDVFFAQRQVRWLLCEVVSHWVIPCQINKLIANFLLDHLRF